MPTQCPELEQYKTQIPEFIVKLYHILEQPEYNEYLLWSGDNEILIKSGKKLEEKVLPYFFRHRHLSSFVRQLNMYKFNKVTKLTKERYHMYFKNEHFQRGCIPAMTKIKRNIRRKEDADIEPCSPLSDQENSFLSISNNLKMSRRASLDQYKQHVKSVIKEIMVNVNKLTLVQGFSEQQQALRLCKQLLEAQEPIVDQPLSHYHDESSTNKNMLTTLKMLPPLQELNFPSQKSLCSLSIE